MGRLVEGDDVIVFIQYVQRQGGGKYGFGSGFGGVGFGKREDITVLMYILAALFLCKYIFL